MSDLTAGIIVIGDEVLKGQVMDTNSHVLCKRLRACGISVRKVVVVADDTSEIAEEVVKFSRLYSFVFTSGGIGPTHDDVTYEGLAKAFNEPLVFNKEMARIVLEFYPGSERSVKENPALKIAQVPKSSELIYLNANRSTKISDNFISIMPVVRVSNVIILPGIPEYFEYVVNHINPLLNVASRRTFYTLHLYLNQDEIFVISALNSSVDRFKGLVVFGSYPVLGHKYYATRITIESVSKQAAYDAFLYLESKVSEGSVVKWNNDPRSSAVEDVYNIGRSSFSANLLQRVAESTKVIENCLDRYDSSELFLSFNGGKDCTVLLHLVSAVFQKKHAHSKSQALRTVYIQCSDPFPEVESFIAESAERYNLDVICMSSPIKVALEKLLLKNPNLKAVLMGTRRTDPYSETLNHFQGLH
ncbi:FAD synthase-like isoform X2 [Bacillus rossius redtenbacheri]|uniref:FAD synthase-like isoform X2 n=1 Tax=Bacillus rossius redtenbacheri TaxID=93214 RepID=UPI002FDEE36F